MYGLDRTEQLPVPATITHAIQCLVWRGLDIVSFWWLDFTLQGCQLAARAKFLSCLMVR